MTRPARYFDVTEHGTRNVTECTCTCHDDDTTVMCAACNYTSRRIADPDSRFAGQPWYDSEVAALDEEEATAQHRPPKLQFAEHEDGRTRCLCACHRSDVRLDQCGACGASR